PLAAFRGCPAQMDLRRRSADLIALIGRPGSDRRNHLLPGRARPCAVRSDPPSVLGGAGRFPGAGSLPGLIDARAEFLGRALRSSLLLAACPADLRHGGGPPPR